MSDKNAFARPHSYPYVAQPGMTMREWYATFAPEPSEKTIEMYQNIDRGKNPHNDSHKPMPRSRAEIIADLKFEYADAMIKASKKV